MKYLTVILLALALIGCKQSIREEQLLGSWKQEHPLADIRLTYYKDHTWVIVIDGLDNRVPSGSSFGIWKLKGDRLSLTTLYTLDNSPINTTESGQIVEITGSKLRVKNQTSNGQTTTLAFGKVTNPTKVVPDPNLSANLVGTWRITFTNPVKQASATLYSTYQSNGVAHWRGSISTESGLKPIPSASGTWRVEGGSLVTTITNSASSQFPINKESRDEILSITLGQFTYRDENKQIKKVLRER